MKTWILAGLSFFIVTAAQAQTSPGMTEATDSPSVAEDAPAVAESKLLATISGMVQVETRTPAANKTRIVTSKLNNGTIYKAFNVTPEAYALVVDPSSETALLELVPKDANASLTTLPIIGIVDQSEIYSSQQSVGKVVGTTGLGAGTGHSLLSAVGGGYTATVYYGKPPANGSPVPVKKVVISLRIHGHNPGVAGTNGDNVVAVITARVTTGKKFLALK